MKAVNLRYLRHSSNPILSRKSGIFSGPPTHRSVSRTRGGATVESRSCSNELITQPINTNLTGKAGEEMILNKALLNLKIRNDVCGHLYNVYLHNAVAVAIFFLQDCNSCADSCDFYIPYNFSLSL